MELTEEQRGVLAGWVEEGRGLSEIQKALLSQFDINMTYMDVRFLLIDLGLDLKPEPEPEKPQPAADELEADGETVQGGVSVDIDRIMKPGALVSGTVVFSDGRSGSWAVDQMGRIALDMGDPDYKPAEEDIAAFQQALRSALEKRGI